MKKVIAIFAIVALAACGGSTSTETVTDSVAAQVDSNAVTATDSTAAQIPVDSAKVK